MYINTRIDKVIYMDSEAFSESEYMNDMFDFCEGLNNRIPYNLDELISDLEYVGNTRAKSWELSCINTFADSRDCYMELMITFENDFYICLKPYYTVEGRC